MPEAIAKYALNSTLGTEDFQPLDKLIESYILRNKKYILSDKILAIWKNSIWYRKEEAIEYVIGTFKSYISGFASLELYCYTDNNDHRRFSWKIYEDDVLISDIILFNESSLDAAKIINPFHIQANKNYKFVISIPYTNYSVGIHFEEMIMKADVINGAPYDYTIGG